MGKNNRARRAAKAKARSRAQATSRERARRRDQADADDRSGHGAAGPSGATGHGGGEGHRQTNDIFGDSYRADPEGWTHDLLVDAGSFQHQEKRNRRYNSDLRTAVLRQLGRVPLDVLATAAERALLGRVEALWQGGWQPVELLRQARLNGSKAITARLMAQVVANDDARRRAATLDSLWISQVEALDLPAADARPGWIRRWVGGEGLDLADARDALIDALAVMLLPRLECLIPPPGSLGAASTSSKPVHGDTSSERDPMLERIRALLAKAESTDFEEEAMAFTTKAQELITRHAIDDAMLADADATSEPEPSIIRVPIDPPYWDAKGFMLQLVAERSRCRAVMMDGLNMSRVVGYPADLTAVEDSSFALLLQGVLDGLRDLPFPTIAAVDGPALGAGAQLAVACDLRVATPESSFGVPAAKLGLMVNHWTVQRIASLVGASTARAVPVFDPTAGTVKVAVPVAWLLNVT